MEHELYTWKFAVTTALGIYIGELHGELEPGETKEQAMKLVSEVVTGYLTTLMKTSEPILACFVSDNELFIAPMQHGTLYHLDITHPFSTPEAQQ